MKKKLLILIIIGLVVLTVSVVFISFGKNFFSGTSVVENFYIGNLHTHTKASDGKMTYNEVIEEAQRLGFNFIAITDHDVIGDEVKELCPKEKRILCIIGEEVSSKEGHILALGIKEVIPKNLTPEETIQRVHGQGGLAIPAHPEAENGLKVERIKSLSFDAVECNARHKKGGKYSCDLIDGFPKIYNSDAHKKEELSVAANKCLMKELTFENLVEAVKEGRCFNFYGK